MKYAVIAISGTQFKVEEGKTITIDNVDAKVGDKLTTDQVLLAVNEDEITVGTPIVKNASMEYEILKNYQGEKLKVFTYKSKSRYHKTKGFRHQLTDIKITKITF